MHEFIANNPKQLDLCLKMLYAEKIDFLVHVDETNKRKIFYRITVEVDEVKKAELDERYRILIS